MVFLNKCSLKLTFLILFLSFLIPHQINPCYASDAASVSNAANAKDKEDYPLDNVIAPPNGRQLIFDNELDNVIAPFTYHSSLLFLSGSVIAYLTYNRDYNSRREKNWREEGMRSKPWREVGNFLGWGALPIGYGLIQYATTKWSDNTEGLTNTEYVGKSVAYSALATFALKNLVRQGRPKDKYKTDSFPSGHASSSFSFSTAIWMIHGWKWGLFASTIATWVSYSRIDDGSHYYHDTVAGATLGAAYAIGIYNNHYHRRLPFLFTLTPTDDLSGLKGHLVYDF